MQTLCKNLWRQQQYWKKNYKVKSFYIEKLALSMLIYIFYNLMMNHLARNDKYLMKTLVPFWFTSDIFWKIL